MFVSFPGCLAAEVKLVPIYWIINSQFGNDAQSEFYS